MLRAGLLSLLTGLLLATSSAFAEMIAAMRALADGRGLAYLHGLGVAPGGRKAVRWLSRDYLEKPNLAALAQ